MKASRAMFSELQACYQILEGAHHTGRRAFGGSGPKIQASIGSLLLPCQSQTSLRACYQRALTRPWFNGGVGSSIRTSKPQSLRPPMQM